MDQVFKINVRIHIHPRLKWPWHFWSLLNVVKTMIYLIFAWYAFEKILGFYFLLRLAMTWLQITGILIKPSLGCDKMSNATPLDSKCYVTTIRPRAYENICFSIACLWFIGACIFARVYVCILNVCMHIPFCVHMVKDMCGFGWLYAISQEKCELLWCLYIILPIHCLTSF